ncbi:hypothetical protein JOE61_002161 [Nocardioides salarius]|uniref:PKD domain-containing protein n=1 Tax=Nocardioides salarius TaxID=374513 RepID=A0ABS2MAX6_9ACTN|nr:PKD domain-containing protein [Nocardioides salarius]MBM7508347.1 hypothetical protein [Nocardioides salarius]
MSPLSSRRSRTRSTAVATAVGTALVGLPVLAVVSAVGGPAGPAQAQSACSFDARFTDPAGDVNDLLILPVDPALDPDGLDLREAWVSTNATDDAITFHIKVTDLSVLSGGLRGTSELFRWAFVLGGQDYVVEADRPLLQPEVPIEAPGTYTLTDGSGTTLKTGLAGSFDPALDLVTVTLAASDLTTASPAQDAFVVGDVLSGFSITSLRSLLITDDVADRATSPCTYRIGDKTPSPDPTATVTATATTTATTTATATATATTTVTSQPTATATTTVTSQPTATATATTTATTTATATATATATETVTTGPGNRVPQVKRIAAKPLQGQGKARVKSPIRFRVKATDPDGDPLTYRWDFGDGNKGRGIRAINRYDFRGQYRIILKVNDGTETVKTRFMIKIGKPKKR